MKVIFMGTPDFAVQTLKRLISSGHEVTGVVTQPDKPKGRGKALSPTPVKEVALEAGIPVFQPRRVRDSEALETLRGIEADVIVVVAFGQLIPKEILEMKKYGCINVHGSLLPKYRGAAPVQWAVIDGEKESGVTTMQMDEGLDTGDMLLKAVIPLEEKETGGSLFEKLSDAGESPTAYAQMLKKDMGLIDWKKSAAEIERLVRGLNPWPSAYTHLNGRTLKIWQADVLTEDTREAPGTVTAAGKDGLYIQTGRGVLAVRELQLEGKKRMDAGAFLRGYQIEEGTRLCS